MIEITDLVFCGVGGQGVLLASEVGAEVALSEGLDVKKSEVHGMAQRGGSVFSHVRWGEKIYSPVMFLGGARFLIAFEELEALRYAPYISRDAVILVNSVKVNPITVLSGQTVYPHAPLEILADRFEHVKEVKALDLARQAGSPKAVNSVMLGLLSCYLSFPEVLWMKVLEDKVPSKAKEINIKAFRLGRSCFS